MWMVQHLAVSLGLVCAVGIACKAGRFRPAVRHALWVVVLIKLAVPPVVTWPWAIEDLAARLGWNTDATPAFVETVFRFDDALTAVPSVNLQGEHAVADESAEAAQPVAQTPFRPWPVRTLAVTGWILGSLLLAGVEVTRLLRFRRKMKARVPVPEWLRKQVNVLAAQFGVRPPAVAVVRDGCYALTWGWLRARIFMPESLVTELEPARLRCVMAHELAHLKRRDHWVGLIELLSACIWWWNPLVWFARRRIQDNAELACDAWVVSALPENRREYADALLHVVENTLVQPRFALAHGFRAGRAGAFKKRLLLVLTQHTPCRVTWTGALALLVLLALVLPGWALESPPVTGLQQAGIAAPEPVSVVAQEVASNLKTASEKPVSMSFENVHLAEILSFIRQATALNTAVDWRVVKLPEQAAGAAGAAYSPMTDGIVPWCDLENVPAREAVALAIKPLNLASEPLQDLIWVSSPEQIEKDHAKPRPIIRDSAIKDKLGSPVSLTYDSVHIAETADWLDRAFGIKMYIDATVIKPPASSAQTEGYVTDGMVLSIDLKEVPLGEALEVILRPLNLTYAAEGDKLWISSFGRIGGAGTEWQGLPAAEYVQSVAAEQKSESLDKAETNQDKLAELPRSALPEDPIVGKILDSQTAVDFHHFHVAGIAAFIQYNNQIDVLVDTTVIGSASSSEQGKDCVTDGIVNHVELQNVTWREVLEATLHPLGLTYAAKEGKLWISSFDRIGGAGTEWQGVPAAEYFQSIAAAEEESESLDKAEANQDQKQDSAQLIRIAGEGEHLRAQIESSGVRRWYKQGESFERYTVMRIDPDKNLVELRVDPDGSVLQLTAKPPCPEASTEFKILSTRKKKGRLFLESLRDRYRSKIVPGTDDTFVIDGEEEFARLLDEFHAQEAGWELVSAPRVTTLIGPSSTVVCKVVLPHLPPIPDAQQSPAGPGYGGGTARKEDSPPKFDINRADEYLTGFSPWITGFLQDNRDCKPAIIVDVTSEWNGEKAASPSSEPTKETWGVACGVGLRKTDAAGVLDVDFYMTYRYPVFGKRSLAFWKKPDPERFYETSVRRRLSIGPEECIMIMPKTDGPETLVYFVNAEELDVTGARFFESDPVITDHVPAKETGS